MERASQRRPPEPLALRLEDRVDARAHATVAGGPAGALVDLLRDRHFDLSEDVVLERRHLGRSAEGDEDSRLQLLARAGGVLRSRLSWRRRCSVSWSGWRGFP